MKSLQTGALLIEPKEMPSEIIRLDWLGRSDERNPEKTLAPYLFEVLDHALLRTASIEMHFEALDYFNSSTVAVIVHFLQRARSHGVRLTFMYRKSLRWQRLSFEALRVFEQVDRTIRVIGVPDSALTLVSA